MNSKFSLLISFFFLLYNVNAFDITKLLEKYSDFSTFSNYLTQTKLASDINSRQTITVLAVDNGNISPLSGKPVDVLRKIMSLHVVLDYYDAQKLQNMQNKTTLLTTLFQASGQAAGQKGFLNVTHTSGGSVAFGSAGAGSTPSANLVKSVLAEPYNISVLQISSVIVPVGSDTATSPSSSPSTAPTSSPTKSPTPTTPTPTPSISPTGHSTAPAISPSVPSTAPAISPSAPSASPDISPSMPPSTPSDAPEPAADGPDPAADAPSNATAPAEADTPDASPDSSPEPAPGSPPMPAGPTADAPAAEAPADSSAAPGTTLLFHLRILMIIVSSAMYILLAV